MTTRKWLFRADGLARAQVHAAPCGWLQSPGRTFLRSFLDGVVNKVLEISTRKAMMLTCNVTEYMERLEVDEF